jgi:DeoR family transcriptional regulator of aga operon
VVTDHSKLDVVANWQMCSIDDIDMLITDTGAPDAMIAPFEAAGIAVKRV